MELLGAIGAGALDQAVQFLAWLGIQPTAQDLVKALILVVFVLAILMIVGDVYRGEIQNQFHRVLLGTTPKSAAAMTGERTVDRLRRRAHREKDITCHVPQTVVPLTVDGIHSNILFYFRYRDCSGKVRTKLVETYKSRFHVRKIALPRTLVTDKEGDHKYTPEEEDRFSSEENLSTISMAGSRVDYIYAGKIEPLMEKERDRFRKLQQSGISRAMSGVAETKLQEPQAIGLVTKFHFPIDPYFLLYRHPDTNVRTTAWLTVLTSVFALFMQLIYGGADVTPARPQTERASLVGQVTQSPPPN